MLENCIRDIKSWCSTNSLVLNDGKTELLHVHSKFARSFSILPGVAVDDTIVAPKPEARSLGVVFDHTLSLKSQITNSCRISFMALTNIAKIRRHLDQKQTEKLVHAFVTSRVDQCKWTPCSWNQQAPTRPERCCQSGCQTKPWWQYPKLVKKATLAPSSRSNNLQNLTTDI